jgi:large subunit ribosomal protein L15
MKLESLKPATGSIKKRKIIGRGPGSGRGGTSTKGHNGAQSRAGYSRKIGFEGGQMPLQRRIPKFGFKNNNRIASKAVNLDTLELLATSKKLKEITVEVLIQNGLIGKKDVVKVLSRGEIKAKISVTVHKFSKAAIEAIEAAGGTATVIG